MGQFHDLLSDHVRQWATIDEYASELVDSAMTLVGEE